MSTAVEMILEEANKVVPEVIGQLSQLTVSPLSYELRPPSGYQVASAVGLVGAVRGFVAICMTDQTAIQIASGMLGMEISEYTEDVNDAAGEIGNNVVGILKNNAVARGIPFDITVPTVIRGQRIELSHPKDHQIFRMFFKTPADAFMLELALKMKS